MMLTVCITASCGLLTAGTLTSTIRMEATSSIRVLCPCSSLGTRLPASMRMETTSGTASSGTGSSGNEVLARGWCCGSRMAAATRSYVCSHGLRRGEICALAGNIDQVWWRGLPEVLHEHEAVGQVIQPRI